MNIRAIAKQVAYTILLINVAAGACLLLAFVVGLRWVRTPSVPPGLWLLHKGVPEHGDYVAVCLPSDAIQLAAHAISLIPGYCNGGVIPMMKHLIAHGGDIVTVSTQGIRVNGQMQRNSRRLRWTSDHHEIPWRVHNGTFRVANGMIWILGDSSKSWDSRYYGPIPESTIFGLGTPLLTERALP